MDLKNLEELKLEWQALQLRLESEFGIATDLQGIIYLIGIQELGLGPKNYSKSEKQDLMHIATCRLLSTYGFYILSGHDGDGWPLWELVEKLPNLSLKEQDILLKRAALEYFKRQ